jgi:hypothetical protein
MWDLLADAGEVYEPLAALSFVGCGLYFCIIVYLITKFRSPSQMLNIIFIVGLVTIVWGAFWQLTAFITWAEETSVILRG